MTKTMIFYFNFSFTFPKGGCSGIFKERLLCVINCIRTYTFLCNKMCYNYALLGSRGFNFSYHYLLVEHTCIGVRFYRNVRGKMALADAPSFGVIILFSCSFSFWENIHKLPGVLTLFQSGTTSALSWIGHCVDCVGSPVFIGSTSLECARLLPANQDHLSLLRIMNDAFTLTETETQADATGFCDNVRKYLH